MEVKAAIVLTALWMGGYHALTRGFLAIGMITVKCDNIQSMRIAALDWLKSFAVCTIVAALILPYLSYYHFVMRHAEYVLLIVMGVWYFISWRKQSLARPPSKIIYVIAFIQGITVFFSGVPAFYAITTDAGWPMIVVGICLMSISFVFCATFITILLSVHNLLGENRLKVKKILLTILSICSICLALWHFIPNPYYG